MYKIIVFLLIIYPFNVLAQNMQKNIENLTDIQKYVTQKGGTERSFDNEYWDNKEEGIYVDIVSGKPLFSSIDKFDSGTGWPSFTKPIQEQNINSFIDKSLSMERVEVKSESSNSHLGHVFEDGPQDRGGKRFCINSASLKFIAKSDLQKEGYGEFLYLFEDDIASNSRNLSKAILAGGCFWGMEDLFANLEGVIDVKTGYSGGNVKNPTYKIVSSGLSGHAESIEVIYDENKIDYEKILRFFLQIHDPTTLNQQGNDLGSQYRSVIFYINDNQKSKAQELLEKADKSGVFPSKIVTKLEKFNNFYEAEEYHQDYLKNNPYGYTCHRVRKDWNF